MNEPLYSFEEEGRSSSPDVGEFLLIALARSRWWIAGILLLAVLIGLAVALARPNEYESVGKLQIRMGAREMQTPESTLDEDLASSMPGVQDELELLGDPALVAKLVDTLGAGTILAPYDPAAADGPETAAPVRWMHQLQSWWFRRSHPSSGPDIVMDSEAAKRAATDEVAANIEIEPARNSNVIHVTYVSHSPELSQQVVRAFLRLAKQKHLDHYKTDPSYIASLLEEARQDHALIQDQFNEFRQTCQIHDLELEKTTLAEKVLTLDEELRTKGLELDGVRMELVTIRDQIAATLPTEERIVPPAPLENPTYRQYLEQVAALEQKLAEFRSTFREESPGFQRQVDDYQAEIARLHELLSETAPFLQSEPRAQLVPNPHYDELISQRSELERREKSLVEVLRQSGEKKIALDEHWIKLRDCEADYRDFTARLGHALDVREDLQDKLKRAEQLGFFDRDEQTLNLMTVQDATLALDKVGPDRTKSLLIAVMVGVFAGCALAVLRQLFDRRLRYRNNVERMLGVPVLGVVPEEPRWKQIGNRARRLALPSPPS
jgi:uncharacterized protein involved in exopolysaccharide biosynthesis